MFNKLLPVCLYIGLNHQTFWDLTLQEIDDYITTYNKRKTDQQKELLASNYNLAVWTAQFNGLLLNGKQLPTLYDLLPDLFADEKASYEKKREEEELQKYKNYLMSLSGKKKKGGK